MEGEKQKRGKNKTGLKREKGEIIEDIDGGEEGRKKDGEQGKVSGEVANSDIRAFRDEVRAFRVDFKNDMDEFRLALREDMRKS
ncbi:hypothetical protein ROHU_023873 [Labeo rohita]|uniref:Uncharacterized protein n=1 Tax=Labeo rohita TaxID=84645 RepID=A0A498MKW5_LABRO|nr:hypothetical protein ROHU_023873 [Labeo rohita]